MRSALFWIITQSIVAIASRRFGTSYRSRLQVSQKPRSLIPRRWNL